LLIVYAAGGNAKLTQIAYEEGWALGVRSDKWHYPYPLTFIDIDYKSKDPEKSFQAHLKRVAKEKPKLATVPDLSDKEVSLKDIERAIAQANQLKNYCEIVLVVPKLSGQIELLPTDLAIGYSIPTSYGGAQYPIWELSGRRVHLLGGSPHEQIKIYRYVQSIGQVLSVDGNYAQKIAIERCKFWQRGGRNGGQWVEWPVEGKDQYYEAFRRSCRNIRQAWLKETAQAA
jgi:hypothetical protein